MHPINNKDYPTIAKLSIEGVGMMSKKRRTRDKESQKKAKPRYTNYAHIFYKEEVAPLERAYKRALLGEQYKEAEDIFMKIREVKKKHRTILMRKQFVKIK